METFYTFHFTQSESLVFEYLYYQGVISYLHSYTETKVLIHDPRCLDKFEDNDIIIPIMVIEELDKLKKGDRSTAYAAREAIRRLSELSRTGRISEGITLPGGGHLKVETGPVTPVAPLPGTADNLIITVAAALNGSPGLDVILVSKDANARIKAEAVGLSAQDYIHDKTSLFLKYGHIVTEEDCSNGILSVRYRLRDNELMRLCGQNRQGEPVRRERVVFGIKAANVEQECTIDALTNPKINVVAITGKAGTGKTLLALACGLHLVTGKTSRYDQVMVARPVVPMGNDLGYLPGDIKEKLAPWMQPIIDNLDVLVSTPKQDVSGGARKPRVQHKNFNYLFDAGYVQVEPLTYIRGRSLPRRYFIIDEAQNLTPRECKTIVTRAGEGTKIIVTGDVDQIDNPYLDAQSNGLSYLISRFMQQEDFCYLNLLKSSRSGLAERAAALL